MQPRLGGAVPKREIGAKVIHIDPSLTWSILNSNGDSEDLPD